MAGLDKNFITDPQGDIHTPVKATRATITAMVALQTKDAPEMEAWLYEALTAAFLRRDNALLVKALELIIDFKGWSDGKGQAAIDALTGPSPEGAGGLPSPGVE